VDTREANETVNKKINISFKYLRDQICLEFVKINIQTAIETKRSGNAGNYLSNQSVKIGEARRGDSKILFANVINSFVINLTFW
jgi:hypothetical protein